MTIPTRSILRGLRLTRDPETFVDRGPSRVTVRVDTAAVDLNVAVEWRSLGAEKTAHDREIIAVANKFGVPPAFLKSQVGTESSFINRRVPLRADDDRFEVSDRGRLDQGEGQGGGAGGCGATGGPRKIEELSVHEVCHQRHAAAGGRRGCLQRTEGTAAEYRSAHVHNWSGHTIMAREGKDLCQLERSIWHRSNDDRERHRWIKVQQQVIDGFVG